MNEPRPETRTMRPAIEAGLIPPIDAAKGHMSQLLEATTLNLRVAIPADVIACGYTQEV
jgi:hypothetical protein